MRGWRRAGAWALLGLLAAALATAPCLTGIPRLFLDAYTPPQPYRWVSPPAEFAQHNQPPLGGETVIAFTAGRSDPASAFTDDGQVTVSFNPGSFSAVPGQTGVRVRITPVRPQPAAPEGIMADGNAYLVEATYTPTGQPVQSLTQPALVDLRYPGQRPDAIYRIDGSTWTPIGGVAQELLLSIDARSMQLGTFAAGHHPPAPPPRSAPDWTAPVLIAVVVVLLLALIVVAGGVRIRLRPARRSHRRR